LNRPIDNFQQGGDIPWYRQFWPWFLIALPASAVIAGMYTLYLAVTHPDPLVIEKHEYRQLDRELKVQQPAGRRPQTGVTPKGTPPAGQQPGH